MNHRQRYIDTMLFKGTDRIPFMPGTPRESTLKTWRRQGLPEGVNWLDHLIETIGLDPTAVRSDRILLNVNTLMIPQFEEKVLERKPGSLIVQDWKGNVCEISDEFDPTYLRKPIDFVTRRWLRCPVETRADWEDMKRRYDPQSPERFPADWPQLVEKLRRRDQPLLFVFSGIFWQLREWLGFEELCMRFLTEPDLVADMAEFWTEYMSAMLKKILSDLAPDEILVNEDMAYKEKAMISPDLTRQYILPAWRKWREITRGGNCPLYTVDSDGCIDKLMPLWIEAGFHANSPVEVAAGNDIVQLCNRYGSRMAYCGGVDKREMAKGGSGIANEMRRLEPAIRAGGFIPGCDHGIPWDVSWPCMVEYGRLLAQATGWL